ncbi:arginine--tRNA ligase [Candidatus Fukatsuia anoeciicola]|uniref:arginine--tRNA ligase n=1 Tax=Candidatus Fukatsuia anoeciicola TaxID=2994492 RepID=UPI003463A90F
MNIQALLSNKISKALIMAGAPIDSDAKIRQSAKSQFGDYQVNGIMAIAKILAIPPRQLAKKVINFIDLKDVTSKIEIVGPGFINIFLNRQWLAMQIDQILIAPKRLGIASVLPQTVVVDYSSPNVAKEMHVGHLRSTIIGDVIVRTLTFLGHNVIRANHIGDWGTQFGMLIAYLEKVQHNNLDDMTLSDLEVFYRAAQKNYDENEEFAQRSRAYVVKLQVGDEQCRKIWRQLVDITMTQNQISYNRLHVTLTKNDIMGESIYNPMLPGIVADLKAQGIAVENTGATMVFFNEHKNKAGKTKAVVIQKKDGGYLYITTDIACVKYRCETLNADRILYYTDSRQHQHLMQTWNIARKAGYIPESVSLEHHMFGMMLDKDGKPLKTRTGGNIKLADFLDEAIKRADKLIREKNLDMPAEELKQLVNTIGIGAVKYADLSKNRTTDYIFNWDNMLTFDGNTAPYMLYAYIRVISIFKRAAIDETSLTMPLVINEDCEAILATRLLQFEETITIVARDGTPHVMCIYLYNLAVLFSSFYEHCPILNATNKQTCHSRLKLALLTAKTLKQGLDTLGIQTVERM